MIRNAPFNLAAVASAAIALCLLDAPPVAAADPLSLPAGSTFGQFVPGFTAVQAIATSQQGRLIQLAHRDPNSKLDYRRNLGYVSAGVATIAMVTDLYGTNGAKLGAVADALRPYEYKQIDKVFGGVTSAGVANGYAIVPSTTVGAAFFACSSVVDNRTVAPVVIPAQPTASGTPPTPTPAPTPTATLGPTAPDLTGTFVGTNSNGPMSLTLTQTGSSLYGHSSFSLPHPYSTMNVYVTGTVNGTTLTLAMNDNGGCYYAFNWVSITSWTNDRIAANYSAPLGCSGNSTTGSFVVVRPGTGPNLAPYQPPGWSAPIVVSNVTGTSTDTQPLLPSDTLFVDWAAINNGNVSIPGSPNYYFALYLDGNFLYEWYGYLDLPPNYMLDVPDFSLGSLSAGVHTLRLVCDSTGVVDESDEGDNGYTKTFTVVAAISCGSNVAGTLSITDPTQGHRGPSYYTDTYEFNGVAGTAVTIDLVSTFDTYLYLINPAGSIEAQNDDSNMSTNSQITYTLPFSGTWKIEATSFDTYVTGAYNLSLTCGSSASRSQFFTLAPCRVLDTRTPTDPTGGVALAPGSRYVFAVVGKCGVPTGAIAIVSNLTVVNATAAMGDLRVFAGSLASSNTSALSIPLSRARANNAIVQLCTNGTGTISVVNDSGGTVHFILDVNGYFK